MTPIQPGDRARREAEVDRLLQQAAGNARLYGLSTLGTVIDAMRQVSKLVAHAPDCAGSVACAGLAPSSLARHLGGVLRASAHISLFKRLVTPARLSTPDQRAGPEPKDGELLSVDFATGSGWCGCLHQGRYW